VRLSSFFAVSALASLLGCYTQPVIPPDKPLACSNPDAAGECPKGFACIGKRVCAPTSCEDDPDCPAGLVCTSRGCLLPTMDGATPPFTTPGEFLDASPNRPGDAGLDSSIAGGADGGVTAIDAPSPDGFVPMDAGGGEN
jgi:hypothetical protein